MENTTSNENTTWLEDDTTVPSTTPSLPDLGPTSSLPLATLRQIHITGIVNLSTSIIVSLLFF